MVESTIQAADEFNAIAGDRYKIEVFPGGVLGGMLEVFDMVQVGGLEMCDFAPDYLSEKDLVFGGQGTPFCFKAPEAFTEYLAKIRPAIWNERLKTKYNLKLLSLNLTFAHDAWCGTKPIHTLEDWKGKVVWVGGPAEAEAITALGASPVTLDWGDGYPAIEKGVVDGGTYGIGAAWMLNWSACTYYTMADFFVSSGGIVINLDTFNEMPPDLQDELVRIFNKHEERMIQFFTYEAPEQAEADLVAGGAEVYHVPADERARWKEATKDVYESYFSKLDPDDAELIRGIITEANQ
jgi:TRAP-type C4-dicarboxylate transport system substrate-binding protein